MALIALAQGRVADAVRSAEMGLQKSRDGGHQKMEWRSRVLLGHALAEQLRVDEALAMLPPASTRVDSQDVTYDALPRVRCRLAAGRPPRRRAEGKADPPRARPPR